VVRRAVPVDVVPPAAAAGLRGVAGAGHVADRLRRRAVDVDGVIVVPNVAAEALVRLLHGEVRAPRAELHTAPSSPPTLREKAPSERVIWPGPTARLLVSAKQLRYCEPT
jgi:hypothetical protein